MIHDKRLLAGALALLLAGGVWLMMNARDAAPSAGGVAPKPKAEAEGPSPEALQRAAIRREAGAQISQILLAESEQDRARALATLKGLGPEGLEFARELFAEMEDDRRNAGAFVLASLGTEDDRKQVEEAFLDQSGNPPALLALAAASLRNPFLIREFLEHRSSPDPRVREAVCYALRAAMTPDMGDILPLLADGEPRVRAAAERSVNELLPKANPATLRGALDRALAGGEPNNRIGALRLAQRVSAPWVVELASRSAYDQNRAVRTEAIQTLAQSGDRAGAAALVHLVEQGDGRYEKVRAANAMGRVDADPASLDRLAAAAGGQDPVVALAAARSLVERGDTRGVTELVRLQHVKESKELEVDDEDADLLRDLSHKVLKQASRGSRRNGEAYDAWWKRVGSGYQLPASPFLPQFPSNH